jgi:heme-degrading monooxygenase HmoA
VLLVLWEYEVKPDALDEFESLYRPDGAWGDLMRQGPGFVSITLWKDRGNPRRYVVADRWSSEVMYEEFLRERAADIRALNERAARTRSREVALGRFDLKE